MITYRLTYVPRDRPQPRPPHPGRHKPNYYYYYYNSYAGWRAYQYSPEEAKVRSGEYRYVPKKATGVERPEEGNITPVKKKRVIEEESESLLSTVSSRRFSEDEESCEIAECQERIQSNPQEPIARKPERWPRFTINTQHRVGKENIPPK